MLLSNMDMNLFQCINKALKDIFNIKIIGGIFVLGLFLLAVFSAVIYFSWDIILDISSFFAQWIPLSILKVIGSFFIIFLMWFFSVLLAFSVITVIAGPFILKRFKHKGYYLYTVVLVLFLSLLIGYILIKNWSVIDKSIEDFLVLLPFDTVIEGVGVIISAYFLYNFFILSMFSLVLLFIEFFTGKIRKIDYKDIQKIPEAVKKPEKSVLKTVLLYSFLFLLLFPLLFVPVVNIFVQIFIWGRLYYEALIHLCSRYCSLEEFEGIKSHRFLFGVLVFIFSLMNFLPVLNFYVPLFIVFTFFHCIMAHKVSHMQAHGSPSTL